MKLPETFKHSDDIMFLLFEPTYKYWTWFEYSSGMSKFIFCSPEFINVREIILYIYLDKYLSPLLGKYRP